MDIDGLERLLAGLESGEIGVVTRDLAEPSPLAARGARRAALRYLDDAPLEERRTQAVMSRRWLAPEEAADLGRLDPEAIARVRAEAWPDPANADELHDALVWLGFLAEARRRLGRLASRPRARAARRPAAWAPLDDLDRCRARAASSRRSGPGRGSNPRSPLRPRRMGATGRGMTPCRDSARSSRGAGASHRECACSTSRIGADRYRGRARSASDRRLRYARALHPAGRLDEWCERRLLARIHNYTVKRLRAEIEPVAARDFLRFLLRWRVAAASACRAGRRRGDGRPARRLRGSGRRLGNRDPAGPDRRVRAELAGRSMPGRADRVGAPQAAHRQTERRRPNAGARALHADHAAGARMPALDVLSPPPEAGGASARAQAVLECIQAQGASFFDELVEGTACCARRSKRRSPSWSLWVS